MKSPLKSPLRVAVPPSGTLAVGAGALALAGGSYLHLALAGKVLDGVAMAKFSMVWALVFSVGAGLFIPLEQEASRAVAARIALGDGGLPVLLRGMRVAGGLLATLLVLLAVGARPVADLLFSGDRRMVVALGAGFAGLATAHVARGVLAGHGRFRDYCTQMWLDALLRVAAAAALWLGQVRSPLAFALVLVVAPVVSVAAVSPALRRSCRPGSAPCPAELRAGLPVLMCSTLLTQLLPNAPVIAAKLLEPADSRAVPALLCASIIVRIPVMAVAAMQVPLLSALACTVTLGDRQAWTGQVRAACRVVAAIGVGALLCVVLAGPYVSVRFLSAPELLGRRDFLLLGLGTVGYLFAMVLGQPLLALRKQRLQGAAWIVGATVFVLSAAAHEDAVPAVENAYLAGCWTVALLLAANVLVMSRSSSTERSLAG
ncbi:hypothetical protein [Kitasatospora sp. MAP5-34]|uniref:hypothetical protein n=1 Tax=Kitasatospora sp. MAP5-34 TaxID=3035102 RepID=UPI0024754E76|nr:hypothetical protein [Kitasatospora sp. MAP5-34]MDH6576492.1 O-antigen/teichoic acid export membrane protein [Kitasatospora sp. MAP5-34]